LAPVDDRHRGPLFLNTEGNGGNEGKTGTEIKMRRAGKQERMKISNSKPQAPDAQTPTVADDDIYFFITRDFNRGLMKRKRDHPVLGQIF
jgi:hypothetical protein